MVRHSFAAVPTRLYRRTYANVFWELVQTGMIHVHARFFPSGPRRTMSVGFWFGLEGRDQWETGEMERDRKRRWGLIVFATFPGIYMMYETFVFVVRGYAASNGELGGPSSSGLTLMR